MTDLCLFCQAPLTPPRFAHIRKSFCCDRHRVAYHSKVIQAGLEQVVKALTRQTALAQQFAGEFERLAAEMDGARQLLERALKKPRSKAAQAGTKSEDSTRKDLQSN
jgi:hypothetical protein